MSLCTSSGSCMARACRSVRTLVHDTAPCAYSLVPSSWRPPATTSAQGRLRATSGSALPTARLSNLDCSLQECDDIDNQPTYVFSVAGHWEHIEEYVVYSVRSTTVLCASLYHVGHIYATSVNNSQGCDRPIVISTRNLTDPGRCSCWNRPTSRRSLWSLVVDHW